MHSDTGSGNDSWSDFEQATDAGAKHTTKSRVARVCSEFEDIINSLARVAVRVATRPSPHEGVILATF